MEKRLLAPAMLFALALSTTSRASPVPISDGLEAAPPAVRSLARFFAAFGTREMQVVLQDEGELLGERIEYRARWDARRKQLVLRDRASRAKAALRISMARPVRRWKTPSPSQELALLRALAMLRKQLGLKVDLLVRGGPSYRVNPRLSLQTSLETRRIEFVKRNAQGQTDAFVALHWDTLAALESYYGATEGAEETGSSALVRAHVVQTKRTTAGSMAGWRKRKSQER